MESEDTRNFWERLGTKPRPGEVPNPGCEHCMEWATTYWRECGRSSAQSSPVIPSATSIGLR